jgi:hypothetical protein
MAEKIVFTTCGGGTKPTFISPSSAIFLPKHSQWFFVQPGFLIARATWCRGKAYIQSKIEGQNYDTQWQHIEYGCMGKVAKGEYQLVGFAATARYNCYWPSTFPQSRADPTASGMNWHNFGLISAHKTL